MDSARPGIKEVAERAGVAVSSVSRVLSGHPDVSPSMQRRVLSAADDIGYAQDLVAQSMRTGSTMTVGFVVGNISNPIMSEVAYGAETLLAEAGYTMLFANSMRDGTRDAKAVRLLRQRRVDGLLLSIVDEDQLATLDELRLFRSPIVAIDRDVPADLGASSVLSDHALGVRDATEHLIGLGHRRIAMLVGPDRIRPFRARKESFLGVGNTAGIRGLSVHQVDLTAEAAEVAVSHVLEGEDPPTALILASNQLLPGVLRSIRRLDLALPSDLSLVACDEITLAPFLSPPLSCLSRDVSLLGATAARLLSERIDGAPPESVVLPVAFTPTASCAPPRS